MSSLNLHWQSGQSGVDYFVHWHLAAVYNACIIINNCYGGSRWTKILQFQKNCLCHTFKISTMPWFTQLQVANLKSMAQAILVSTQNSERKNSPVNYNQLYISKVQGFQTLNHICPCQLSQNYFQPCRPENHRKQLGFAECEHLHFSRIFRLSVWKQRPKV